MSALYPYSVFSSNCSCWILADLYISSTIQPVLGPQVIRLSVRRQVLMLLWLLMMEMLLLLLLLVVVGKGGGLVVVRQAVHAVVHLGLGQDRGLKLKYIETPR